MTEALVREPLRRALASRALHEPTLGNGTASAVLIPLFERRGEVHLWFVRRPEGMRRHGGQVAFPGGKADPSDASPLATALREAHEEIGLPPSSVDVLGRMEDLSTITGFAITPYVAWLRPEQDGAEWVPEPNPAEVARVFAAPLALFLEPPTGVPPLRGYKCEGEFVWGATAAMSRRLGEVLRGNALRQSGGPAQ